MKKLNKAELRNYIALVFFIFIAAVLIGLSILLKVLIPYQFLGFAAMSFVTVAGLMVARNFLSRVFKIKDEEE
jgi:membrane protein implicated in regulation of membrane protease activity